MSYVILRDIMSIKDRISGLFTEETRSCRRVILGAHVGTRASEFLPDVQDVEIYCCPLPGATNPYALEELQERGARIFFVDRLNMKLCWVKGRGAVIGLANLNLSDLPAEAEPGANHEMVVYFEDSSVIDIEEILSSLTVEPLTAENLSDFKEKHHLFWKTVEGIGLVPDTARPGYLEALDWAREWRGEASPCTLPAAGPGQLLDWYQYLKAQMQKKEEVLCSYDSDKSDRLAEPYGQVTEVFAGVAETEELAEFPDDPPLKAFWSEIIATRAAGPGVKQALQEAIQEYGIDKMIVISLVPKEEFLEILKGKLEHYRRKIN